MMLPDWHCGCVVADPETAPLPEIRELGTGNRAGDLVLWVPTHATKKVAWMGHGAFVDIAAA
jgi:hypothetical protein